MQLDEIIAGHHEVAKVKVTVAAYKLKRAMQLLQKFDPDSVDEDSVLDLDLVKRYLEEAYQPIEGTLDSVGEMRENCLELARQDDWIDPVSPGYEVGQ